MRDLWFRLTTEFFERVYAPLLLLFWVIVLLGAVAWLIGALI